MSADAARQPIGSADMVCVRWWFAAVLLLVPAARGQEASPDLFRPARARALVIGAGDYERLGRLRYARRDAEAFAEALVQDLGFQPADVRLLVDGADADARFTPTLGHVRTALADLLADPERSKTDLFVLFFAGHGVAAEGGDYLLPTDVGPHNAREDGIGVRDLVERLTADGAQNVLLVLDACRDGARHPFGREVLTLAREGRLAVLLSTGPGSASYESATKGAGLFTHYLVRALRNPKVFDPRSGALWVSRVGAEAAARVRAYTEDGFDTVQVPEVHLPPGEDVLLAARLPEALDAKALRSFADQRAEPGSVAYSAAVEVYAQELYLTRRFAECAAVLEAAEQLDVLSPNLGYALVRSLFLIGRTGEGRRALERLRARYPNEYGTLAATVQDLSGVVPMAERVAAARALLQSDGTIGEEACVAALLALKDGGSPQEALATAQHYAEHAPDDSQLVWVAYALVAAMQGRDDDAIQVLEQAERTLESDYPRALARQFLSRYLEDEADHERLLAHFERWIAEDPRGGRWLARRAAVHAARGNRERARADAKAALQRGLAPEDVVIAVRAAGFGALALRAELDRQLEQHPDAWQVVLAHIFVHQDAAVGIERALDELGFTSGRRAHMMALLSQLEVAALEDGVATGEVDPAELVNYRWSLLERTLEGAGRFSGDPLAWELLVGSTLHLDRTLQAARAVRHHLGAALDSGSLAPELCGTVALALLSVGDLDPLAALRALLPEELPQRASLGWFEVALRTLRDAPGDRDAAAALAQVLAAPGGQAEKVDVAWHAVVAARAGDVDLVRAALGQVSGTTNAIAIALAALAHETIGELDLAQRAYQLVLDERVLLAPYLRPLCLLRLFGLGATTEEDAGDLAFLASREGPGNPLYERLSCVAPADVRRFEGAHTFELQGVEGPEGLAGTLRLFIGAEGRVDGFVNRPDGAPRTLEGRIDGYGNLRAKLGGAATATEVFAKLAPSDVRRGHPTWAEHGQLFLLLDESGQSSVWIGR